MLSTPPKPHVEPLPDHEYVVLDGAMRIAVVSKRTKGSITADLYKNLSDLNDRAAMERGIELAI